MPTAEPTDRIVPAADSHAPAGHGVAFATALRFWLKLGFISFGGPAGQIAIMHRELVEQRKWISEERFLRALNYCMVLPGPEAQQLATYVGWLLHRIPGGIVAGGLFVLPSVFVLLLLSYLYVAFGQMPTIMAVLWGFRAVVVAIVCEAVLRIGRRAIASPIHFAISAAAFAAIYFLKVPFPLIVLGALALGWTGSRLWPDRFAVSRRPAHPTAPTTDSDLPVTEAAPAPHTLPSTRRFLVIGIVGLALWAWPFLGILLWRGPGSLHVETYLFFTQAALVTFGGAYAVLAYVSQAAVGSFGWLSQAQAVDGMALAETTPGPLIMVVQFIGFMAAWNHPQGMDPLVSGLVGALVTTFVTFLPSFLFIFLGAPYIELLRHHRALDSALGAVTAAVVGVILNLALVFGAAVLLPAGTGRVDWLALGLAALAFFALWRLRVDVLWVVLAGGFAGFLQGVLPW